MIDREFGTGRCAPKSGNRFSEKAHRQLKWHAVQTHPGAERAADVALRRRGYLTLFPMARVKLRRKIRGQAGHLLETVEVPHLTGYGFLCDNRGRGLMDANDAPGVAQVLHLLGEPFVIPGPVIDAMFEVADLVELDSQRSGYIVRDEDRTPPDFAGSVGDRVSFREGSPLEGLCAQIAGLTALARTGEIDIWLEMFGSVREVSVSVRDIGEISRCDAAGESVPLGQSKA